MEWKDTQRFSRDQVLGLYKRYRTHGARHPFWYFYWGWKASPQALAKSLEEGSYAPQPMRIYPNGPSWSYQDKILQKILYKIIQPVFKHILSLNCLHLNKTFTKLYLRKASSKTRMGEIKKGFHYLGINYAVTQIQHDKIQVDVSVHERTLHRARLKLQKQAVTGTPVKVQCYLDRWASWWSRVLPDSEGGKEALLVRMVDTSR